MPTGSTKDVVKVKVIVLVTFNQPLAVAFEVIESITGGVVSTTLRELRIVTLKKIVYSK